MPKTTTKSSGREAVLRYPVKIGGVLFQIGLKVRRATQKEARKALPKVKYDDRSEQVAVWFPGFDRPTVVHRDQLVL